MPERFVPSHPSSGGHPWRTRVALWLAPWLRREIEDLRESPAVRGAL